MSKGQLFVNYHWKQITLAFVVVVALVAWQTIGEERELKKIKEGQVAGVSIDNSNQQIESEAQKQRLIITYQASLKNLLKEYLQKRASSINDQTGWLTAIEQTKADVLKLSVPDEYKELHLAIVTTMDREKEALKEDDQDKKQAIESAWAEILEQYFWLNN
ncbi:MAG TPA: hypothetical protein PLR18_00515 [bacterium]|nr:hypothetical protein [bacterium]